MAYPRKKLKVNRLFFEDQTSYPSIQLHHSQIQHLQSDSNSNTSSPIHVKDSNQSKEDSFITDNYFIQQTNNQNVLISEQFILDESNDVEMRINEWLDKNNVKMVSPEDIIHDFYQKIKIQTLQKMEIELKEFQYREEQSQNSSSELDFENLDYSHNKKINKQKNLQMFSDKENNRVDLSIRSIKQDRQIKRFHQNLTLTSNLLQRRINQGLVTQISGIDYNNYVC